MDEEDAEIERILALSEAEVDAELRAAGIDPEAAVARVKQIVADVLAMKRDT